MKANKFKSLSIYTFRATAVLSLFAGFLLWRTNPTNLITKDDITTAAMQNVGIGSTKAQAMTWLKAQGFEIDESNYSKNGNVVAIVRDTTWGLTQNDIYFTFMFDQTNSDQGRWMGWQVEERSHIL